MKKINNHQNTKENSLFW